MPCQFLQLELLIRQFSLEDNELLYCKRIVGFIGRFFFWLGCLSSTSQELPSCFRELDHTCILSNI